MNDKTQYAKECLNKASHGEHEIASIMSAVAAALEVVEAQQTRIATLEARLTKLNARLQAEIHRRQNNENNH
jgi:hypothetical protein